MRPRLPPTVFTLGWVSLLMDIASEMVYPLLPLFMTTVLGASKSTVGLVEGVAEATSSLLKVVGGRISDQTGARKPLLLLGYGLPGLLRPWLAVAGSALEVLGFRFADRVGKGLRTAPRDALLAEVTPPAQYGQAYGLHRAMDSIGATIGPLLATLLLPLVGYRGVFWWSLVPALLAGLLVAWKVREKRASQPPAPLPPLRWQSLGLPYRRFLLVSAVFALALSSNGFVLLRLGELGLSTAQVTLAYTGYNLLYALTSYPLGLLADRIGARRLVGLGFGLYGLVYLGLGLAHAAWQGLLCLSIYALYSATFEGSSRAYLATLIPAEQKATAIGLYHTVVGLLLLPASLGFGLLYDWGGAVWAFGSGTVLAGLALVLHLLGQGHYPRSGG